MFYLPLTSAFWILFLIFYSEGKQSKKKFHYSVDFRANGDAVYAILYGVETEVGENRTTGKCIIISLRNVRVSYCHLSKTEVRKETVVRAGDRVAISGNSGRSSAPHLHLSCTLEGERINPMRLIDHIIGQRRKISI